MRSLFSASRYIIYIAVFGLLFAAVALFIFAGITTVLTVIELFGHGDFSAEGLRVLDVEMIEIIDTFLLGTILFIMSLGLYQLFIDPDIELPEWLSVESIDELKFNLVAVIAVMLLVLFLGAAALADTEAETFNILHYGGAIAAVLVAAGIVVYLMARVHHMRKEGHHETVAVEAEHGEVEAAHN